MNYLAQMLSTGPMIGQGKVKAPPKKRTGPSPEAAAKQVETKKRIRQDKWRRHFNNLPNKSGSTNDIASLIKQASAPTLKALYILEKDEPPAVAKIGTIEHDQIIWKWILD